LIGMPRRTNTGASYANPESMLYQPDWMPFIDISVIGGSIMFLAIVIYIVAFFATVSARSEATLEAVTFPVTAPLHDEPANWLRNFKPYIYIAIVLIVLSYTPVILDVLESTTGGSLPYSPNSPVPLR